MASGAEAEELRGARADDGGVAEDLQAPFRLVVAPRPGMFNIPGEAVVLAAGDVVRAGRLVGRIERLGGTVDVVSPYDGVFMGWLARHRERVRDQEPLAWVTLFD